MIGAGPATGSSLCDHPLNTAVVATAVKISAVTRIHQEKTGRRDKRHRDAKTAVAERTSEVEATT